MLAVTLLVLGAAADLFLTAPSPAARLETAAFATSPAVAVTESPAVDRSFRYVPVAPARPLHPRARAPQATVAATGWAVPWALSTVAGLLVGRLASASRKRRGTVLREPHTDSRRGYSRARAP